LGRAEALLGLGRPDEALLEVEEAVTRAPDSPEALVARGRYHLLYTSSPDVPAAMRDFDAALEIRPGFAPAHLARGWAALNFQNDPQAALPDLREAVRLDLEGENAEAHRTLAVALHRLGDAEAALAEIETSLSIYGEDAEVFVESAAIRRTLGDLAEAVAELDAAIAIQPDFAPYHAMRAYLLFERGEYDAALAGAEDALRLNPGNAAALYARGLTYLRLSDYERAIADLDTVLAHEPFEYQTPFLTLDSLREINLDRALVLQAMPGREAEALAAFDLAVEAQPEWFAAYFYRGVYLAGRGMAQAARADLQEAARLAPDAVWRAQAEGLLASLGE
jgi:tetratricopeptide (TPR) repeat protein